MRDMSEVIEGRIHTVVMDHIIPNAEHSKCRTFQMQNIPNAEHSKCRTFQMQNIPNAEHSKCTTFQMQNIPNVKILILVVVKTESCGI